MAKWLVDREITHIFGIIGAGNIAIWNAVAAIGKTQIVSTHHEQAATMAASYYARARGELGIALVTTGAGSSNALTGVLAAYMDGTPLLVISGNEASRYMGANTRVWGVQGYDSSEVARKMTKGANRLTASMASRREPLEVFLDSAADLALSAPQGPVWIDFPKDLQSVEL